MRDNDRQPRVVFLAIALSLLAVLAPVVGVVAVSSSTAAAAPPGFVGVPDNSISDKIPDHAEDRIPFDVDALVSSLRAQSMTDEHADTLEIVVTTKRGRFNPNAEMALEVRDDTHHEGRRIAIPAKALERALDRRPELAFGRHENGTEWTSVVEYEYDPQTEMEWAIFRVPAFSTNTITWTGQLVLEGKPATDGAEYTYEQNDTPVGNYTINVTGHTATEWDNESRAGVGATSSEHTSDSDFNAGTVTGAAEVAGSGDSASVTIDTTENKTYSATGSVQTYEVPDETSTLTVTLLGAGTGRAGGRVKGTLSVTAGETLYVYVGESNSGTSGGWPDGGNGATVSEGSASASSEGGAGYTAVRQGGDTFSDTVALAGGAGGDGDANVVAASGATDTGSGGQGGADTGEAGGDAEASFDQSNAGGGGGGSQSSGGAGGEDGGQAGSQPNGGDGAQESSTNVDGDNAAAAGGGGGAGYHGGGGGGADAREDDDTNAMFASGAGGGAGSNYDDGLATVDANQRGAGNTGDGEVTFVARGETGTYVSPAHSVENSNTGYVDIPTLTNASVTITWETTDGSGWETLAQKTVTSPGNHSATWADEPNSTVRVNVTATNEAGDTDINISNELVTGAGPSKSATPAGNLQPTGNGATGNATIQLTGKTDAVGDSPGDVTVETDDGASITFSSLGTSTVTKELNVTTSTTAINLTFTSGEVDYQLNFTERTQTVDPTVEVNGNTTSHDGTLADGTTQTLTSNTAWVVDGTNRVNITVGDGSLTADAPTPSVDFFYTHDGEDKSTVEFTAEKWSESYNVSKTFATDQNSANLTIPFSATVVQVRSLEKQVNGGGFSSISSSNYSLSGNTLEINLGAVSASDEVHVRTDGSKVNPNNASITVQEATSTGDADLNTKIKLDTWNSDSYIGVGGTEVGSEIHYIDGASWSNTDASADFDGDEQHLKMPKASAGDTLRVKTLPVEVTPVAGDVIIQVETVDLNEPRFVVSQGDSIDDTVHYKFLDAKSGQAYILWSVSNGIVRDSGTASSPLELTDDDSDETLEFQEDDGSGDGGGGGGGSGGGGGGIVGEAGRDLGELELPLLLLAVVLGIIALFTASRLLDRGSGRESATSRAVSSANSRIVGATRRLPLVGRALGAMVSGLLRGLRGLVTGLASTPIVTLGILAMGAILLLRVGVVDVSSQLLTITLLVAAPLGTFIALVTVGRFDVRVWVAVSVFAFVALAESIRPGSLLEPLGSGLEQMVPLLVLGGGFLLWQALKSRRPKIVLRSERER